jgi:hypothetical protein
MRLIDADQFEVEVGDEVILTLRFPDGRQVTVTAAPGYVMEAKEIPREAARAVVDVPPWVLALFNG